MNELIITLIIGIIGGTIAMNLKIPAGAMIGSMVFVSIFSIITGHAFVPQNIKIITQIAAGAFIGSGIKRKDVLDLRLIIKPAVQMVSSMIILDLFMGYIMFKITGLDLVTTLFATAPAGIVDMSIVSDDLGADTSKVAVLHLIRIVTVLMLFPTMMKFISKYFAKDGKGDGSEEIAADVSVADIPKKSSKASKSKHLSKEEYINFFITVGIASIVGLIGYLLKVPAGAMTFAMIAIGALNVFSSRGFMPLKVRRLTQMLAGALVGSRVGYGDVLALKSILIPAIILIFGMIVVNLVIGFLITRTSSLELITSLLASAPGGLSDMALIAKDLGGDAPKVAILHLIRVVSVIAIFPMLIKFIIS